MRKLGYRRCWIDSSSKRCFRCCKSAGTIRSLITATGFGPSARRIRRCSGHSSMWPKATAGWSIFDLEKFFDRVCHDKLMARIAARISDKRMLRLIRAFLTAGVMQNGLVSVVDEGTPQGGPVTPRTRR